ncbi:MAG: hypothetical protein BWY74_03173 [Firmicutes bacterium ADurb.Bin419]|nr:MAG: hypothetical protein BWY74_03173 [Firmicutes bacterium ADurb.Bin419]
MPVVPVKVGFAIIESGPTCKSLCTNPQISPTPLISSTPLIGGQMRLSTAVSSTPIPITSIFTYLPLSQSVRFLVPYMVAPVPYIISSELKGLISMSPIIQPSFGEGVSIISLPVTNPPLAAFIFLPHESQGAFEISIVYFIFLDGHESPKFQIASQVVPASVDRKM